MFGARNFLSAIAVALASVCASAQAPSRLAILIAEDRRAPTAHDLATIRSGLHSRDLETARIAVRALGRLERPELITDLVPLLKSPIAEIRAEAANGIGQAAQGWKRAAPPRSAAVRRTGGTKAAGSGVTVDTAATALGGRLQGEDDPMVRGALCQTLGRLPYTTAEQVEQAESTLSEALTHEDATDGRLGIAQGLEALVRLNRKLRAPSAEAVARLVDLASGAGTNGAARVRRLALEALISTDAIADVVVVRTAGDPDAQLRRLAMRAAAASTRSWALEHSAEVVKKGMADPSAMVRFEALAGEGVRAKGTEAACATATSAVSDRDANIALLALDQLAACSSSSDAVAALERTVNDLSGSPRSWQRPAHALVALAGAAPDKAAAALPRFAGSTIWQVRMYGARAAAVLGDRAALEKLATDQDDNVCEAAIEGLSKTVRHGADGIYAAALGRRGYQAVRQAAVALSADRQQPSVNSQTTTDGQAIVSALQAALQRFNAEAHDNSRDARGAIADALDAFGVRAERPPPVRELAAVSELTGDDLRRLASARARVTIRGLGAIELALFAAQAPATCIRFARLAQSGYYNGLTFHRVVPNFVIQGGSPGANEYVGDASYMRDEVGSWPHVRGAVGISTRGRDTGDGQIFVDLVDNPRLDHEYTVFAQVLNGLDVVDQILEGDVIEKVEILTP